MCFSTCNVDIATLSSYFSMLICCSLNILINYNCNILIVTLFVYLQFIVLCQRFCLLKTCTVELTVLFFLLQPCAGVGLTVSLGSVDGRLAVSRDTTTLVSSSAGTELDLLGSTQPLHPATCARAERPKPTVQGGVLCPKPSVDCSRCSPVAVAFDCCALTPLEASRRPARVAARMGVVAMLFMIPELGQVSLAPMGANSAI